MGTNFYWKDPEALNIPYEGEWEHIGKRSAAGWYCWDCEVPLVQGGKQELVHTSHDVRVDTCPTCGQGKASESMDTSSVGVELGFAAPRETRPTGVHSCSSFSWAQNPSLAVEVCRQHKDEEIIDDEYGRALTGQAFLDMLDKNCPIQFTHSIGLSFS